MSSNSSTDCLGLDEGALATHAWVTFVFEYVLQWVVGSVGFVANALAVVVLASSEMRASIFNRLLVFLAIFDNVYIVCSVLEAMRKHHDFNQLHELAFGHFLYQLHNFILCCSIYTTLALALERYRAIWRPVEYHNRCKGANPWARVAAYIVPVLLFSALFNIPKFLEVEFVVMQEQVTLENDSNIMVNRSLASPTELRLDELYVILYTNVARLVVQGVVPFGMLSVLNYRIYWVIKHRRQMLNRPKTTTTVTATSMTRNKSTTTSVTCESASQRKANETLQAVVLSLIVLLFFLCHTPRFVLNVHELLTLDSLRQSIDSDCNQVSAWALNAVAVSHLLMTLNCSTNFFIYCVMCKTFRANLRRRCVPICKGNEDNNMAASPLVATRKNVEERRQTIQMV